MLKSKINLFVTIVAMVLLFTGTVAAEDTLVRWWDWSDSIKPYTEQTFGNYEKENPGINIEYDCHSISSFNEILPLAVRSGDAPDVHGVQSMDPSTAVENNWFQPLDPYINEIYPGGVEAWKAKFPEDAFAEGLNMFNGQIYSFPRMASTGAMGGALLFYNKDLFREAGLDPERPPKTWSEFREYARKITETGAGDYYGMIMGGQQVNRWATLLGSLAKVAGRAGFSSPEILNGFDYKEGKYSFEADNFVKAMDLLLAMKEDGSFYPGFLGINAPDARARFGNGEAGFIVQGKWCISTWNENNPDLDLGVAFLPVPDEGRGGYIGIAPLATHAWEWALSSHSENPLEAVKLLLYRMTDENMIAYNLTGDGLSPFPELNTPENSVDVQYMLYEMTTENTKIIPVPQIANPNTGLVLGNIKTVRPNFAEIAQGAFTGALDYAKAAADLSNKMNQQMDRVIEKLQSEGVDVSREDFTFPDWDPLEDYIME